MSTPRENPWRSALFTAAHLRQAAFFLGGKQELAPPYLADPRFGKAQLAPSLLVSGNKNHRCTGHRMCMQGTIRPAEGGRSLQTGITSKAMVSRVAGSWKGDVPCQNIDGNSTSRPGLGCTRKRTVSRTPHSKSG